MPSNHLILCRPRLLPPSIFPSIRVFSKESVLHFRPKYWSFNFIISPSNEYSRLISFRMDWLDLLAVQRTLKSLLQHHSSKASILRRPAFFMVQLSHPYLTTGKAIALTSGPLQEGYSGLRLGLHSMHRQDGEHPAHHHPPLRWVPYRPRNRIGEPPYRWLGRSGQPGSPQAETDGSHPFIKLSSALGILTCKTSAVPVFPGRLPGRGNPKRRELVPERVLRGIAGAEVQRSWRECCRGAGWELGKTQASTASGVVGLVLSALGSQRSVRGVFLSDESGTSLGSSG